MEMFVVEWPGPDALQPGTILPVALTEVALDGTVDENPRHPRVLRGKSDQLGLLIAPPRLVEFACRFVDQNGLLDVFARCAPAQASQDETRYPRPARFDG